jgi:putative ABC transport system permease protein
MKSIGATNEHIFLQFLIESGMLGLIGGLIGSIIGVSTGVIGISVLNSVVGGEIEPVINIWLIVYSLVGSFFIGAIAGIVPALSAAKQKPVEALRG